MKHTLLMVPIGLEVGLSVVSAGLAFAIESQGVSVSYINPFKSGEIDIENVETLLSQGKEDAILESIIRIVESESKKGDVLVVQGFVSTQLRPYVPMLNNAISKALGAEVIFVLTPGKKSPSELKEQIEIALAPYGGVQNPKLIGCLINKIGAPTDPYGNIRIDLFDQPEERYDEKAFYNLFNSPLFKTIGCVPWQRNLMAPRVKDVAKFLKAKPITKKYLSNNRVQFFTIAGATIEHVVPGLKPDVMIITPADRSDIIVATCMAFLSGTKIAGLLLTGDYTLSQNAMDLCHKAIEKGLPILSVKTDSLRTAISLQNLSINIPKDDTEKLDSLKELTARCIDQEWIKKLLVTHSERNLSPPAFRYKLIEKAREANKKIVLPEGEEPRIIEAAAECARRKIARITLLGAPKKVYQIAEDNGIDLDHNIEILDPQIIHQKHLPLLLNLRKEKGLTEKRALEALQSNIVVGTLMLYSGEVDGLVAGAIHTTAETIRPALMLVKAKQGVKKVSSLFFMCLPEQVLVYGDCAVNQSPNAEELADIAIQCADSAERFGIPARVAMISYSTGTSGKGADVEKVQEATEIAKHKRPDLLIDGPLQYDAAFSPNVALKKAPNSPVAGKATVYVFPDLNTANTTYKAVQRSADVLSIGPVLQGLNSPVNDLSRGALVNDIIYTIAITAIQGD